MSMQKYIGKEYEPRSLYWQRFSIAERYGKEEILTVYNEAAKEFKHDCEGLSELALFLKAKTCQHCEEYMNSAFCDTYKELYESVQKYAHEQLEKDEFQKFCEAIC